MRKTFVFSGVAILAAAVAAHAATDDAADIFTYVFDTTAASAEAYAPEAVLDRGGWVAVEQDNTSHEFTGDAVLRNDRLVVVIRRNGPGAEVYVHTAPGGFVLRGVIAPFPGPAQTLSGPPALDITDNTPGAVALRATYATDQKANLSLDLRLVTGQIYVQVDPGDATAAVDVNIPTQWLVVPDFFADDLVYCAASTAQSPVDLPAENFLIHLAGNGCAVVTCLWASNRQTASALVSNTDDTKAITGSRITSFDDNPIWVAFLEAPGAWYGRALPDNAQAEPVTLDWTPPFPADWRADFTGPSELSLSQNFQQARVPNGTGGPRPLCWFKDGHAYVHSPDATVNRNLPAPTHALVYPIDRTQDTPLNVYCLVDIMRSTLGLGACQYILDVEGLDAQATPTPAKVADWVEKQFEKGRDTRYADAIRERTTAMVEHVVQADARIGQYSDFARTARELSAQLDNNQAEAERILVDLDLSIARFSRLREAPMAAGTLAERLNALIGQPDAYEACRPVAGELRALGHAQDRTLSSCRMNVRRLHHLCRSILDEKDQPQDVVERILGQTRQVLGQ